MKTVEIYTDGACIGNPGPGGWAAVLIYHGHEKEIFGGDIGTTNNRMELSAVIEALSALKEPCEVNLYSDSKYVCNSLNLGWAKSWKANGWQRTTGPALNPDLWDKLLSLCEIHKVNPIWVKGHSGNKYNERCDELATTAAKNVLKA